MQILKLFQRVQPITNYHNRHRRWRYHFSEVPPWACSEFGTPLNIGLAQIVRRFLAAIILQLAVTVTTAAAMAISYRASSLPLRIRIFVRHVVMAYMWQLHASLSEFFDWQISHGYFCFVSYVNTLKRNWNKTISLKQNIILRLFCFSYNHGIREIICFSPKFNGHLIILTAVTHLTAIVDVSIKITFRWIFTLTYFYFYFYLINVPWNL